VHEWCLDEWHDSYQGAPQDGRAWYQKAPQDGRPGNQETQQYYRVFLTKSGRVLRGGSFVDFPRSCRSAYRYYSWPNDADDRIGFRVVCLPKD
jgi:formylglycine-generating enzyme required for sulfatase activity